MFLDRSSGFLNIDGRRGNLALARIILSRLEITKEIENNRPNPIKCEPEPDVEPKSDQVRRLRLRFVGVLSDIRQDGGAGLLDFLSLGRVRLEGVEDVPRRESETQASEKYTQRVYKHGILTTDTKAILTTPRVAEVIL